MKHTVDNSLLVYPNPITSILQSNYDLIDENALIFLVLNTGGQIVLETKKLIKKLVHFIRIAQNLIVESNFAI